MRKTDRTTASTAKQNDQMSAGTLRTDTEALVRDECMKFMASVGAEIIHVSTRPFEVLAAQGPEGLGQELRLQVEDIDKKYPHVEMQQAGNDLVNMVVDRFKRVQQELANLPDLSTPGFCQLTGLNVSGSVTIEPSLLGIRCFLERHDLADVKESFPSKDFSLDVRKSESFWTANEIASGEKDDVFALLLDAFSPLIHAEYELFERYRPRTAEERLEHDIEVEIGLARQKLQEGTLQPEDVTRLVQSIPEEKARKLTLALLPEAGTIAVSSPQHLERWLAVIETVPAGLFRTHLIDQALSHLDELAPVALLDRGYTLTQEDSGFGLGSQARRLHDIKHEKAVEILQNKELSSAERVRKLVEIGVSDWTLEKVAAELNRVLRFSLDEPTVDWPKVLADPYQVAGTNANDEQLIGKVANLLDGIEALQTASHSQSAPSRPLVERMLRALDYSASPFYTSSLHAVLCRWHPTESQDLPVLASLLAKVHHLPEDHLRCLLKEARELLSDENQRANVQLLQQAAKTCLEEVGDYSSCIGESRVALEAMKDFSKYLARASI